MPPKGYDIGTLFHWLVWEIKCADASGEEFQKLFESVVSKTDTRFMAIRPYGNIGDRKCDGLFFHDGVVFQVYSPDELTQAETQKKIEEDLAGAVAHWGPEGLDMLKKWVFIYNTRRRVPPDIPKTLHEQARKYPWLEIDSMSSGALWDRLRAAPAQVRAEVLGPVVNFEHLPFGAGETDAEILERLQRGRFVLIHDAMVPIDRHAVADALLPDVSMGPPLSLRHEYGDGLWEAAADFQAKLVEDAIARSADLRPRFAVFSLSTIPLVVHLGFLLSDRVEVQGFQYDRDRNSWRWDDALAESADLAMVTTGVPDRLVERAGDVVIRVSLSALINPQDTKAQVAAPLAEIDLTVAEPDKMWLRSQEQLVRLAQEFRRVLRHLDERVPNTERIHLFVSAPTPACVVLGQAINPRMVPPVALYEFNRQRTPRYRHVLTLTVNGAKAPESEGAVR